MSTARTPDADALLQALPPEAAALLEHAAAAAQRLNCKAYLVGGIVRDLILGRPSLDLDLAVEGDAAALARAIEGANRGRLVVHHQFGTATLYVNKLVLDLASTRAESYPRPGALPSVKAAGLAEDLARRDVTINAMALPLQGATRTLIDPLGGLADLRAGVIRVLNPQSFRDDPTRMLRAVRYEQRFGFRMDAGTEVLLRRDSAGLAALSGERLRYDLERILGEERPEDALARADALGLLGAIHPALRWGPGMSAAIQRVREHDGERTRTYVAVMALAIGAEQLEPFAARLSFPREWLAAARDAQALSAGLPRLEAPGLRHSQVYLLLKDRLREAVVACWAAEEEGQARRQLRLYLDELSAIRPLLTGRDILAAGVPQGPRVGAALAALTAARLDGLVASKDEELSFLREWASA